MTSGKLLKVVPIAQSAALAAHSYRFAKQKKKRKLKDFVKHGVELGVGAALVKETAKFVGEFD